MAKRILVVDDEQYIRDLYVEFFSAEGFEVDSAVDGVEGLKKMQDGGYNLILLDVMMPQFDGVEVLEQLTKQPPKVPNGPVVILTNLTYEGVAKDALQKGAADYIVKADVNPGQLLERLKKYLQ
jgi:two-component system, OmpR family, response regulator VanR